MSGGRTKRQRAEAWVNGSVAVGTGIVIAACVPGTTTASLMAIEANMCHQIGRIYRGDEYTMSEARLAAGTIGLAAVIGKALALEACNLWPGPG